MVGVASRSLAHMNSMANKLCFCTWVEVTSQVTLGAEGVLPRG